MRPSRDTWAMGMAVLTAERTTCLKRKVGCVLLNARGHVLATGNNGVASGQPHCNEVTNNLINPAIVDRWKKYTAGGIKKESPILIKDWKERGLAETVPVHGQACRHWDLPPGQDKCEAIHAEQNALLQCRDVYDIDTAYVTLSPCMACAKLLLNTGCKRIVFLEEWTDPTSRELWTRAEREWELFPQDLLPVIK